jgi:hyperosmotically inducible protein
MHMVKGFLIVFMVLAPLVLSGCEILLIGGAAATGYKLGTDQKTVGEAFDDSMITASVKTRLVEDKQIRALNIDVDTNLGEVTLSGFARSKEEIDRAVIISKGVNGVNKVVSLLKVRVMQ